MNLMTARSGERAKEIGIRKVAGAHMKDVIKQFFSESMLLSFISLVLAVLLVKLFLPTFNGLVAKELTFNLFTGYSLILKLGAVALITGIFAGSYPALVMSSFQPVNILKGNLGAFLKNTNFRRTLVILQYVISIILIISTTVINKQVRFLQNMDLGINKENLVYVPLNRSLYANCEAARQELLRNPNISNISMVSFLPTGVYSNDDGFTWQGKGPDINPVVSRFCTDYNFLETFESEMIQGDFYSHENIISPSDIAGKIIINERFAEIIGSANPVGKRLSRGSTHFTITGVIKDFNFMPLYGEIGPLALYYKTENSNNSPARYRYMCIKLSENISQTIDYISQIHQKFSKGYPFQYRFLSDDYNLLYSGVGRMGKIIKYFSVIAIFISCMGLFGLASYMAAQRTKEIGVRKALGSSVTAIVLLLSKEFSKWILIANIVSWPLAYLLSRLLLQDFAYKTKVGIEIFLLTAVLTLIVAFLTVSYQTARAARTNPVETLKYE
jgi:ABC-type antimicrobial peptide transport system permease subunit